MIEQLILLAKDQSRVTEQVRQGFKFVQEHEGCEVVQVPVAVNSSEIDPADGGPMPDWTIKSKLHCSTHEADSIPIDNILLFDEDDEAK